MLIFSQVPIKIKKQEKFIDHGMGDEHELVGLLRTGT